MSNNLLSLMGWSFLPSLVTGWVQTIYYGVTIRAGTPSPTPGTQRYARDRRRIQILVVSLYLLYTIYEADFEITRRVGSFYADLRLEPLARDSEIKSSFRRLAARYHPDKVGSDGSDYYVHLKLAHDTLMDSARRFAYDRFGPEVINWRGATTLRDYVVRGTINGILPHYGMAVAVVYGMGWLGYLNFARYYRWLLMLTLCVFELYLATRPSVPLPLSYVNTVLGVVWPSHGPFLQFQAIALARRAVITMYVAFAQLGPLLMAETGMRMNDGEDEKGLGESLDRLDTAAKALDSEAARLWEMEMAPYAGDRDVLKALKGRMQEWLVQNTIRADPAVKESLGSSFRRRRMGAGGEAAGEHGEF